MSKPESIKIDPWVGFPRQPYSIIDDDFCHDKAFVAKVAAKSEKATVNIKETLNSKKGAWSIADEVKLWFDLPNKHSLYAKVKSTDYIKILLDGGVCEKDGKKWNAYASLNSNKLLKNIMFKVGAHCLTDNCQSDNRLRVNFQESGNEYHRYHRTYSKKDKYNFGLLTVVNLGKKILEKNNLLLAYTHNSQHSLYVRLENDGYRKENPSFNDPVSFFDNVIVDYVNKIDDKSKAAVEVTSFFIFRQLSM